MRILAVYSTADVGKRAVRRGISIVREIVGFEVPDSWDCKARVVAVWYLSSGQFMEVQEDELRSISSMSAYAMLQVLSNDLWVTSGTVLD